MRLYISILRKSLFYTSSLENSEVLFCVQMLSFALLHAKIRIFRGREWWGLTQDEQSLLLRSRMIQAGWCPYTVKLLEKDLELDCQVYAFCLGSTRTRQDHSDCTPEHCDANQVKGTYRVKHRSGHCQCESIGPALKDVNEILRNGQYPVLTLTSLQPGKKLQLKAAQYTNDISYISISHVWSDSLGNPISNAVPYCQLLNIEKILRKVVYRDRLRLMCSRDTPFLA